MISPVTWTILVALALVPTPRLQVGPPAAPQVDVTGEVSVAMDDIGGRPVVDVRLNGRGPYRMVVDTGANRTVIDPTLIAELALPSAVGTPGTGPLRVDELSVGNARVRNLVVGRAGSILAALGPEPPRGILSAMTFPGAILRFDFPRRRVVIQTGELPASDGRRTFQFSESDPLPTVPVTVNDVEFRVHLDTGAPLTVSLPTAAARTLSLESAMVKKGVVRLPSGEFPRYESPFSGTASLGMFPLSMTVIGFSDMRAGPQAGKGVIGMSLLRDFVVSIDARHRRVMFERATR